MRHRVLVAFVVGVVVVAGCLAVVGWTEARREVHALCGLMSPGTPRTEVERILGTARVLELQPAGVAPATAPALRFTAPATLRTAACDVDEVEIMAPYGLTQAFSQCGEIIDETDQTVTLSGSLTLAADSDYAFDGEFFTFDIDSEFSGSVNWSMDDGRSGTCAITMNSEASFDGEVITATTSGSACGVSANETFTTTIG